MRKNLLSIIGAFAVFVVVAIFAFYINSIKTPLSDQADSSSEATSQPTMSIIVSAKVTVDTQTNNHQIEVAIRPSVSETVPVSALALKTTLSTVGGFTLDPKANEQFFVNPSLKLDGWSFPIAGVSQKEDGNIELDFSGYRLGGNLFNLEEETVLVTIPISPVKTLDDVSVAIDTTYTKFLGLSATEEIPLITK